jgi:hypothetical protein
MKWLVVLQLNLGVWVFFGLLVLSISLIEPISGWLSVRFEIAALISIILLVSAGLFNGLWMNSVFTKYTKIRDMHEPKLYITIIAYFIAMDISAIIVYFISKTTMLDLTIRIVLLMILLFVIFYCVIFSVLSHYERKS